VATLPDNPSVGDTVTEDFEMFDIDNDAYMTARNDWLSGGRQGPMPQPEDYLVSLGIKTNVYFWNSLCWLQWVYDGNPVNIYIPEDGD